MNVPEFTTKADLFAYLKTNKKEILADKRAALKTGAGVTAAPSHVSKKTLGLKSDEQAEDGTIIVQVAANAAGFFDSHKDVIIPGAPSKSIRERKHLIPHLHDHIHTTEAEVGDVLDIFTRNIPANELGYPSTELSEVVVFETKIIKEYNPKVYKRYKNRRATQHSIGLRYVKIFLCIDAEDPEYSAEKAAYDKYIGYVINREEVEKHGYFYAVTEYVLMENSVVLFGSNPYTGTLATQGDKSDNLDTYTQPSQEDTATKAALARLLNNFKTLNNDRSN